MSFSTFRNSHRFTMYIDILSRIVFREYDIRYVRTLSIIQFMIETETYCIFSLIGKYVYSFNLIYLVECSNNAWNLYARIIMSTRASIHTTTIKIILIGKHCAICILSILDTHIFQQQGWVTCIFIFFVFKPYTWIFTFLLI